MVQGQTRQHARLLNLLGVRQLVCGVNKMDSDTAGYKEARYEEIKNEMQHMLIKVGWKKDFVEGCVPYLPISGWMGDNLIKKSENMTWWKGSEVKSLSGKPNQVDTLLDYLNKVRFLRSSAPVWYLVMHFCHYVPSLRTLHCLYPMHICARPFFAVAVSDNDSESHHCVCKQIELGCTDVVHLRSCL